jgi:hypothetical protein
LVVIDRETGAVPLSAAERMKIWDARFASQTPPQPQMQDAAQKPSAGNPWSERRSEVLKPQRPAKLAISAKSSAPSVHAVKDIGYGPIIAVYAVAIALLILFVGWEALPVVIALVALSLMKQWPQKIRAVLQKLMVQQGRSGTDSSARP